MSRGKHGTFSKATASDDQPARPETRYLGAQVPPEAVAAVAALAKSRGVTSKALMVKAVALLLEEQCEPVPASLRRQLARLGLS